MTHEAKRLVYEEWCDGCGNELPSWVTVITDRSGSENAVCHSNPECIEAAIHEVDVLVYG
jgi:hypothetical protein